MTSRLRPENCLFSQNLLLVRNPNANGLCVSHHCCLSRKIQAAAQSHPDCARTGSSCAEPVPVSCLLPTHETQTRAFLLSCCVDSVLGRMTLGFYRRLGRYLRTENKMHSCKAIIFEPNLTQNTLGPLLSARLHPSSIRDVFGCNHSSYRREVVLTGRILAEFSGNCCANF